jgi:hypothetical protein
MNASPSLAALLLTVALNVSVEEFAELLRMNVPAIQERFNLPRDCEPRVSASQTDPSRRTILVLIECRVIRHPPLRRSGKPGGTTAETAWETD